MNYDNYATVIVQQHHVKLVGWSPQVPFQNPSNIGSSSDLRIIWASLQSGTCKWVRLTRDEVKEFAAEQEKLAAAGGNEKKGRKKRKDAGKQCKRATDSERNDGDQEPGDVGMPPALPTKRRKRVDGGGTHKKKATSNAKATAIARSLPLKSRELISDSSDNEHSDD